MEFETHHDQPRIQKRLSLGGRHNNESIMNLVDVEGEILNSKVTDVEAAAEYWKAKQKPPHFRSVRVWIRAP
jgi:hypothetical protein